MVDLPQTVLGQGGFRDQALNVLSLLSAPAKGLASLAGGLVEGNEAEKQLWRDLEWYKLSKQPDKAASTLAQLDEMTAAETAVLGAGNVLPGSMLRVAAPKVAQRAAPMAAPAIATGAPELPQSFVDEVRSILQRGEQWPRLLQKDMPLLYSNPENYEKILDPSGLILNPELAATLKAGRRQVSTERKPDVSWLADRFAWDSETTMPQSLGSTIWSPELYGAGDAAKDRIIKELVNIGTPLATAKLLAERGAMPMHHISSAPIDFASKLTTKEMPGSIDIWNKIGTHAGSAEAARMRGEVYRGFTGKSPKTRTFPLVADTSKPYLWQGLVAGEQQMEKLLDLQAVLGGVPTSNAVRKQLQQRGFNTIPYINDIEDAGSMSFILLNPDRGQVRFPSTLGVPRK